MVIQTEKKKNTLKAAGTVECCQKARADILHDSQAVRIVVAHQVVKQLLMVYMWSFFRCMCMHTSCSMMKTL